MAGDALRDWLSRRAGFIAADGSVSRTESPIEAMFARAYNFLTSNLRLQLERPLGLRIWCQHQIGPYRVDFMIEREGRRIVVECDGHDFHERTKEQAERDKSRDRELTALGYTVMRFTGSEIWRNPFAAAQEVIDLAMRSTTEGSV